MVDLFLVRHGIAHARDPETWPDDSERTLTPEGEERCRVIADALVDIAPAPVRVMSSPFERAWRTALILHEVAGWPEPQPFPALEPEVSPRKTFDVLASAAFEVDESGGPERVAVAVVGHRPNIHTLASFALTGTEDLDIKVKKGGALCIRFPEEVAPAAGQLRWLLTPKTLLGARLL